MPARDGDTSVAVFAFARVTRNENPSIEVRGQSTRANGPGELEVPEVPKSHDVKEEVRAILLSFWRQILGDESRNELSDNDVATLAQEFVTRLALGSAIHNIMLTSGPASRFDNNANNKEFLDAFWKALTTENREVGLCIIRLFSGADGPAFVLIEGQHEAASYIRGYLNLLIPFTRTDQ